MSQDDLISRLSVKSQEHIFLDELENSFELSPKEARGILDSAKTVFNLEGVSHPGNIRPGQIREIVLTKDASAGKPLSQLKKVEIEDLDVLSKYGRVALREARILRLMEEALDQEGILTQEDLSRILKVDVRTIKRDIAHLRKQGYLVHTRGQIKGIGRGKSHKVAIIELYLQRYTYTEISWRTRHSPFAIKRYLTTFSRMINLKRKGVVPEEIAFLLGISSHLAEEYLRLYQKYNLPQYQDRIEDISSLSSYVPQLSLKKGAIL
jgi:Mn-dependent DtxR family transcriptional regulator